MTVIFSTIYLSLISLISIFVCVGGFIQRDFKGQIKSVEFIVAVISGIIIYYIAGQILEPNQTHVICSTIVIELESLAVACLPMGIITIPHVIKNK